MASTRAKVRRTYHHKDLRAALIETATKLIAAKGVSSFSLREAARVVGVDAAACYRHFRDRQDLLVAIAQGGFFELASRFEAERARLHAAPPLEVILAFGRAYLGLALEQPAVFRVMFGESGLRSRDQRLRLPEIRVSAYEHLAAVSAEHVAAESLTIDPTSLANGLWAVAHGIARLTIDGALPLRANEARAMVDTVAGAVLRGCERKPTRSERRRAR